MSTLKTTYTHEGSPEQFCKEVDLGILKQYSLNEIRLMFVMNFMMPIKPIISEIEECPYYLDDTKKDYSLRYIFQETLSNDKIIKLEHEQVLELFPSKNTFYDTVKKLIDKDIIKRAGRNKYSLPKGTFALSDDGGTHLNIFPEFSNTPFDVSRRMNEECPDSDYDPSFDNLTEDPNHSRSFSTD